MSNPSFADGRIKIGMSSKDPVERKSELESSGVPEPFVIEYKAMTDDYQQVEQKVHRLLDKYRPNKNREFFTCTTLQAIAAIRSVANVVFQENNHKSPAEIEELRKKETRQQEKKQKSDIAKQMRNQALGIQHRETTNGDNQDKKASWTGWISMFVGTAILINFPSLWFLGVAIVGFGGLSSFWLNSYQEKYTEYEAFLIEITLTYKLADEALWKINQAASLEEKKKIFKSVGVERAYGDIGIRHY